MRNNFFTFNRNITLNTVKKKKSAKNCRFQRVDKVDTLIRRTKMDAGEEARSRQYKGTAMSDDEASKVCKIAAFGIYDKSYRNKNAH